MIRPAPLLLVALALAACTARGPDNRLPPAAASIVPDLEATASTSPSARGAAPRGAAALAVLPGEAGRVADVAERPFRGGVSQVIGLGAEGAGRRGNRIDVTLVTGEAGSLDDEPGGAAKPSRAGIHAELAARFPGVEMRVVDREHRNDYGVYGLAVGRAADGARCLYAWQWIDSLRGSTAGADPVSLRVRLCRSDLTLDQLAALVERVRISPARSTAPTRAQGGSLEAVAAGPAPAPTPARTRARPTRRAAAPRPVRVSEPRPAERPLPEGEAALGADGRRYLAAPAAEPAPAPKSSFGSAVAGPPRQGRAAPNLHGAHPGAHDRAAAAPGERAAEPGRVPDRALDPSLPAQAYLGPAARARSQP